MGGGNQGGFEAEERSRQVMVRSVIMWWSVSRAGQGLGQIGRAMTGGLGRLIFPERGAGVCQNDCLEVGSTEKESLGTCSG